LPYHLTLSVFVCVIGCTLWAHHLQQYQLRLSELAHLYCSRCISHRYNLT